MRRFKNAQKARGYAGFRAIAVRLLDQPRTRPLDQARMRPLDQASVEKRDC